MGKQGESGAIAYGCPTGHPYATFLKKKADNALKGIGKTAFLLTFVIILAIILPMKYHEFRG
jgi:hypothetical protein